MPLKPLEQVRVRAVRPDWLTAGTARLLILSGFVVAVGMIRTRLSAGEAAAVVLVGAGATIFGALWLFLATRRLLARLPLLDEGHQTLTDAVLISLRRLGLPLLGLAFFLLWTFVYLALWAVHSEEAFRGLPSQPRFADFFYYAVATAFISPPGDILATSRGARSATMIEMLTAFALLTAYLSSFVDWRRPDDRRGPQEAGDRKLT